MLTFSFGMSFRRFSSAICPLARAMIRGRCQSARHVGISRNQRTQLWGRGRIWATIAIGSIICGLAVVVFLGWGHREYLRQAAATQVVGPGAVDSLRPRPIVFLPDVTGGFAVPEEDLGRILRKLEPPSSGMPAALGLHALIALGLDARFEGNRLGSGRDLLRLFTDDEFGRAYFGAPLLARTRFGVRPALDLSSETTKESHYDQTLGCLGQLALPLTLPIRAGGKLLALRDVLRDSIACFELRQSEIEWTAIAYASYLPPHRGWTNKFGERYTFDQIADELLRRDLTRASCCGCHIVEAVLTLLRVDREVAVVLSPDVRRRLDGRLKECVGAALSRQEADGSWGPQWYRDVLPASAVRKVSLRDDPRIESQLLATSHLAHLLMYLPERSRGTHDALTRSEAWIYRVLRDAKSEFILRHYCPSSHGAWVLRIASSSAVASPAVPPGPPQRRSTSDSSEESLQDNPSLPDGAS